MQIIIASVGILSAFILAVMMLFAAVENEISARILITMIGLVLIITLCTELIK